MSYTVESKSQLAKLLATENLRIEHRKIQTAQFDPKNRILYCPIWEQMSGELYDLLMGHEVGHALYTPPEGWHDAISNRGSNFKGFLNVVEDARIEKKIKRKYPGLNVSFLKGYDNLLSRDFFKTAGKDINSFCFIDRLNIYFKSSSTNNIVFSEEEQELVKKVSECESWEDVLRVTEIVFDYSKKEQQDKNKFDMDFLHSFGESDGYGDEEFDGEYEDSDGEYEESSEDLNRDDSFNKNDSANFEDSDEEEQSDSTHVERFKESQISKQKEFEPRCLTDEEFRKKENSLLSEQCKDYLYLNFPKPIIENIVTPAKRVHELIENYYKNYFNEGTQSMEKLREFKSKNERYVSLLAKEFEMRKSAKAFSKAKTSNTGDIDIDKLYKYKVDDNIFQKITKVPKGKSHGLILLLDRSGSMQDNMSGSIEQIIVLSMFCRKVNIPFVVYGFGNSEYGKIIDDDLLFEKHIKPSFQKKENTLAFGHVFLREYLNSKMGNAEFNRCLRNLVKLKEGYSYKYGNIPYSESLSNTPLNEAMLALVPITNQFRKMNNLDIVNLVVVHDGDSDTNHFYYDEENIPNRFYTSTHNVFLCDGQKQFRLNSGDNYDSMRQCFFNYYREKTDAKIFGFFLAGKGMELRRALTRRYFNNKGESAINMIEKKYNNIRYAYERTDIIDSLCEKMKQDKFIESFNPSYNGFYILFGGKDLSIDEDKLEVSGNITTAKLKNAFMKMNHRKQVNRVLVSRFVQGIAT